MEEKKPFFGTRPLHPTIRKMIISRQQFQEYILFFKLSIFEKK